MTPRRSCEYPLIAERSFYCFIPHLSPIPNRGGTFNPTASRQLLWLICFCLLNLFFTALVAAGNLQIERAKAISKQSQSSRVLRIENVTASAAGQLVLVPIELEAQGNENALGFSLNFNPAMLSFSSAAVGADATGATLNVNAAQASNGRLGLALALPAGQIVSPGTAVLVQIGFTVLPAASGTASLSFGDQPVAL